MYLDEVLGAANNIPLGHSGSGLALRLSTVAATSGPTATPTALDPTVPKILWEDANANSILTISSADTPVSVVWGSTSGTANAQPTHRWYLPDNTSNAWRVSDNGSVDYISVTTTNSSEAITLGNATTNPHLTWTGSGAWSVGGGYGSSGQVLTSNGSSAAPTWQTISGASTSSGTSSNNYEVNNDAPLAVSSTTGSLTISSNDGAGSPTAWSSTLTQATSGPLVLSTVANGVNSAPTLILGLDSTSAAGTSVLKLSAASGGTQRTASLTWTASTQVLTVSPVTSFSLAPTAPGGSSSERWGSTAAAPGANCGAFGYGAVAGLSSSGDNSTAVGTLANAGAARATVIGEAADGQYADTFVGGQSAAATAAGAVVIGRASSGGASVVLNGSDSGTSGRFVVGRASGPTCPISEVIIGRGSIADTTATSLIWRTTDATGSNINGTDQTWQASIPTGTGTGGYLRWMAALPAGGAGSGAGSLVEVMRIDGGAAGGRIAWFGGTPVAKQTIGAVTNSVTAGGVDGTIADYTIVDYATDAAAIRNAIYQLARSTAQMATALRAYTLGS